MTNLERIRNMSEDELITFLMRANDCELAIPFCVWRPECDEALNTGEIPDEWCRNCMRNWLHREVAE